MCAASGQAGTGRDGSGDQPVRQDQVETGDERLVHLARNGVAAQRAGTVHGGGRQEAVWAHRPSTGRSSAVVLEMVDAPEGLRGVR